MLPRETDVGLTGGTGADVVSLAAKLAEVADGVGASGDGLGLQSFDLIVDPRSHLRRHDAAEIVLEIELVDDVEKATAVDEDARGSAVGPLIDGDRLAADWHDENRFARQRRFVAFVIDDQMPAFELLVGRSSHDHHVFSVAAGDQLIPQRLR